MHRFVDPSTSLGEILFGLIMTLTFTLGAGIIIEDEGRAGAHELLIAAIGCNIAWGIIDGVFYLINQVFERGRLRRIAHLIRGAPTRDDAEILVAGELDDQLVEAIDDVERLALYQRVVEHIRAKDPTPNKFSGADFAGALTSCLLVIVTSLPAAIPFLFIDDARLALRVSNAILLALLFVTGFSWARYTLSKPWLVGLCFLIGGIVLVLVAIALGG